MIVSLFVVLAIELCRSYSKFRFVCLGVLLPALVLVGGFELRNGVDMEQLSVITENRTDLWKVAWAKFTEKPLTGYGADSWGDDLISRATRLVPSNCRGRDEPRGRVSQCLFHAPGRRGHSHLRFRSLRNGLGFPHLKSRKW